jgi:NCAIR mutase (PurE)-related protein
MLNSCSPGISVVNIDNGFGAGYLANLINQGFCGYARSPSVEADVS